MSYLSLSFPEINNINEMHVLRSAIKLSNLLIIALLGRIMEKYYKIFSESKVHIQLKTFQTSQCKYCTISQNLFTLHSFYVCVCSN